VLSDFFPDICPWADIAVALPVFTYGQNYKYVINKYKFDLSVNLEVFSKFVYYIFL
jgi:hypothetical protein